MYGDWTVGSAAISITPVIEKQKQAKCLIFHRLLQPFALSSNEWLVGHSDIAFWKIEQLVVMQNGEGGGPPVPKLL